VLSTRAPIGHLAIAGIPICTNQGCRSLVLRGQQNGRYYYYQLLAARPELESLGDGSTFKELAKESLESTLMLQPSRGEQIAITVFLDRATQKIDALVAKKERLIELLQEKRAALITHAVTKGLPSTSSGQVTHSVPMKDSGVEWLGQIPAHWSVKRLKFSLRSIEQGWSPSCLNRTADLDEWGVLKVGCVNGTEFNPEEHKALPVELSPIPELEVEPGDILMSRANTRELLGSAAVVEAVRPKLLLCDKLYRLKVANQEVDRRFLVLVLGSANSRFQMEREATGASGSMQNIGQETVRNILLPIPPVQEQEAIVGSLAGETAKLDALIAKVREGIEKLKEYRTALISAAVTGKIDVRQAVTTASASG
jgi:type I restriction enzyme S subunit